MLQESKKFGPELCEPLSISTPHSIRIDKILNLKMREPLSITPSLHQETNKLKLESTKIEPVHVKLSALIPHLHLFFKPVN